MLHKQKVEGSNTAFARLFKTLSLNQQKLYQTKGFFDTRRHFWKTFSYFFPISARKSVVLFFRHVRHDFLQVLVSTWPRSYRGFLCLVRGSGKHVFVGSHISQDKQCFMLGTAERRLKALFDFSLQNF